MQNEPVATGLRLQIILSLLGVMLLSFLPLFFAIASLTRVSLLTTREAGVATLARSVAVSVDDAMARDNAELAPLLAKHLSASGLLSAGVFDETGSMIASAGAEGGLPGIRARVPLPSGQMVSANADEGGVIHAVARLRRGELVLRVSSRAESGRDVRFTALIALYFALIALTLVTFAYFSLTRLIVRPLEGLVSAANRVAGGTRSFDVPRDGPREVAELAASVREMATALIREESAQKQRVEELVETTRRLLAAREQLVRSERMASVGRLAAGLAHEIGNPIAALLGLIDLVLAGDLPREKERDFMLRVHKEAERIRGIVQNLLEFARPETAGAGDAKEPGSANVREVTEHAFALLAPQKAFRSIRLAMEIPEGLPPVGIGPARLTQVLLNILLNGAQALENAGREAGAITVRASKSDRAVTITVEDDGPGVREDVASTLFEPFVTTKPVGAGTGLGLAVCRGIVEGAGGAIEIDRSYASGARFVVSLPFGA